MKHALEVLDWFWIQRSRSFFHYLCWPPPQDGKRPYFSSFLFVCLNNVKNNRRFGSGGRPLVTDNFESTSTKLKYVLSLWWIASNIRQHHHHHNHYNGYPSDQPSSSSFPPPPESVCAASDVIDSLVDKSGVDPHSCHSPPPCCACRQSQNKTKKQQNPEHTA